MDYPSLVNLIHAVIVLLAIVGVAWTLKDPGTREYDEDRDNEIVQWLMRERRKNQQDRRKSRRRGCSIGRRSTDV